MSEPITLTERERAVWQAMAAALHRSVFDGAIDTGVEIQKVLDAAPAAVLAREAAAKITRLREQVVALEHEASNLANRNLADAKPATDAQVDILRDTDPGWVCPADRDALISRIDTERAARLAADARVKLLEQAIDEFMPRLVQTCCGKGVQVSEVEQAYCGQPDYIAFPQAVDELHHARATLKESSDG